MNCTICNQPCTQLSLQYQYRCIKHHIVYCCQMNEKTISWWWKARDGFELIGFNNSVVYIRRYSEGLPGMKTIVEVPYSPPTQELLDLFDKYLILQ